MDQHTFGGLGLMGRLIDFDTDDGGAGGALSFAGDLGADGSLLGEGDLGGDGGAAGGAAGDDGAAAGGDGGGFALTQDMWDELVGRTEQSSGFVSEVMQAIEEEQRTAAATAQQQAEQSRLAGLDWTNPEQALSELDRRASALAEAKLKETLGPYQPILDSIAQERGERMVKDALDGIAGEIGEFDRNQALLLSNAFLANGIPPETAFRQAATVQRNHETKLREDAVAQYLEKMRAGDDAGDDPSGGGGAARQGNELAYDPRSPDKYEQLAQDWARRQAAKAAAGGSAIG